MSLAIKPIIYAAFANPEDNSGAPLPELKIEEARIRDALTSAIAEDASWDYQQGLEATRAALVERFYSNRVAVFHFGGHADPQRLLLPGETPGRQLSNAVLLEDFLSRQESLKFAFFNACSTREWAQNLVRLGVPCVIATSRDVNSEIALEFASVFYQYLAHDATIAEAFAKAKASLGFTEDSSSNAAPHLGTTTREIDEAEDSNPDVTGFPWDIYQRDAEAAAWKLSIGANDPLIGLPPLKIDSKKLPASPYVSIKGHTPADAPLFFGRNAEIRSLYDWVLRSSDDPPILLFYGQSGVGKSSLLNAGLLPRLNDQADIVYTRRTLNLTDDLHKAIGGPSNEDARAWLTAAKPKLIILDQIEEAITHSDGSTAELHAFITRVIEIFSLRGPDSTARLILSFRKEYLAEIRNALTVGTQEDAPPLEKDFWLERLDLAGIKQVVAGPTRLRALREKYKITLADEDLPADIAHDLEDRNSPIATILQIILNQLWKAAKAKGGDPVYTRALYKSLSNTDNPLQGFFDAQIVQLEPNSGGTVNNDGLELDFLYEHTTQLVTSKPQSLTDLQKAYPQITNLSQFIARNKELYLLTDAVQDAGPAAAPGSGTALAHDTLAPVIRREFELSVQRGSRARRLLENRAREWPPGKSGDTLDAADLRVVEKGLAHMRAMTGDEQRLVAASRKRNLRNSAIKAAVLIVLPLLLFGLLVSQVFAKWNDLEEANSNATRSLAANDGAIALAEALEAERLRTAWQLRFFPLKALDETIGENLFNALQTREVYREKIGHTALNLRDCAVALDEHNRPLFTTRNGKPTFDGFALPDGLSSTAPSPGKTTCDPVSRTIAYLQNSPDAPKYGYKPEPFVFIWQKGSVSNMPFPNPTVEAKPRPPLGFVIAPGGMKIAFSLDLGLNASAITVLDRASGKRTLLAGLGDGEMLGFSQDGRYLLLNDYPGVDFVDISSPKPHASELVRLHDFNDVTAGKVGNSQVVAVSGDKDLLVQSLTGNEKLVFLPAGPDSVVSGLKPTGVAISSDGKMVASDSGGRIDLWGIEPDDSSQGSGWLGMPSHEGNFKAGPERTEYRAFSPDSQFLATLEVGRNHIGPYVTYSYGNSQPTTAADINALHVSVWKVQPYSSQDLKGKTTTALFGMGCALIGNYIADMATNPDIREDNQHFDFGGLQKACTSAQAGR